MSNCATGGLGVAEATLQRPITLDSTYIISFALLLFSFLRSYISQQLLDNFFANIYHNNGATKG